jgi:ATP-dependent Clp endopeptidase proteolytic subunit ClpP
MDHKKKKSSKKNTLHGFSFAANKKTDNKECKKNFAIDDGEDSFNKIKFWQHVDNDTCDELLDDIKSVEDKLAGLHMNYGIPIEHLPPIEIHINSWGGSVFAALAVVDYINSSKYKFVSIIEGCAASAATFISIVCDERKITKNGMVLIHQLSAGVIGKMAEMVDEINTCHKLMNIIITMYREHTNVSVESIKRILSRDIYWNAEEALKLGIVDSIIEPIKKPRRKYVRGQYTISTEELETGMLNIQHTLSDDDNNLASLINTIQTNKDEGKEKAPTKKKKTGNK